jgi:pyruvate/2-oxoacid:ferredoxin oxidoreductase alpha subunit
LNTTDGLEVLTGAAAVAHGVRCCKPGVMAAYPISPQTYIIEDLASFVANKSLDAHYVLVESELSAISVIAGATAQGVRSFTATSSQGLLFMHEMLQWCAGGRLPLVMVAANRAVGAPWNLWCDQQDMLSQRDTGWMQVFATSAQDAMDLVPIAYKVAEASYLPVLVGVDGFFISHTSEPVRLLSQEEVDGFLPPFNFQFSLDHNDPFTLWPTLDPEMYHKYRGTIFEDQIAALRTWREAFDEWKELTGRGYSLVGGYYLDDAKVLFVTTGYLTGTASFVVNRLRDRGERVGLLNLRLMRPFPSEELRKMVKGAELLMVLDRAVSYGVSGIVSQEIRAALAGDGPIVKGWVVSTGGREVFPSLLEEVYKESLASPEEESTKWI